MARYTLIMLLFLLLCSCTKDLKDRITQLEEQNSRLIERNYTLTDKNHKYKESIKRLEIKLKKTTQVISTENNSRSFLVQNSGYKFPTGYSIVEGYYQKETKELELWNGETRKEVVNIFYLVNADSELIKYLKTIKLSILRTDKNDNIGIVVSMKHIHETKKVQVLNSSADNLITVAALLPLMYPRGDADRAPVAYIF